MGNSNSVTLTTESIFLFNNLNPCFMSEALRRGHVGKSNVIVSNLSFKSCLPSICIMSSITFTLSPDSFSERFSIVISE
jgi:hypothetical protein